MPPFSKDSNGLNGAWQRRFQCVAKMMIGPDQSLWKALGIQQPNGFWDNIINTRNIEGIETAIATNYEASGLELLEVARKKKTERIASLIERSEYIVPNIRTPKIQDKREDGVNPTDKVRVVGVPAKRKAENLEEVFKSDEENAQDDEENIQDDEENVQDDEVGRWLKTPNSFPTRKCPSTPTPISRLSSLSPFDITDIFSSDEDDESGLAPSIAEIVPFDCPVIINDVVELELGSLPRKESRWIVNDIDVSEKWHLFKEASLKLAKKQGLLVESHVQQILSLSHIALLKPQQHCPLMVEVFGAELLEAMHKDVVRRLTEQETEFDAEVLIKLTRIVKRLQREKITRDMAALELQTLAVGRTYVERAIFKAINNIVDRVPRITLKSPVGEAELCTTYMIQFSARFSRILIAGYSCDGPTKRRRNPRIES